MVAEGKGFAPPILVASAPLCVLVLHWTLPSFCLSERSTASSTLSLPFAATAALPLVAWSAAVAALPVFGGVMSSSADDDECH